ncbi:MAG: UDP-N-acetylmuramate:L-alanyl-gamma-D-glutamyl-meso-diaminopimelate ligase [Betaproteobacteria bacterium RBG_16_66_20]|nr:MAG: UDP-N-acetylmuramate:L-alanyl-gamma-D-glutamyl-meso-diaminopimelate ligase [Betaproteobacteria bacterium RBG_16_66_20]
MHLHILGICGTFMGGIAAIAKQAGFRVSGCDAEVYPPMSEQLAALGIELIGGYGADQLRLAPDLWVVGNVVARGNPLMEAILDRGDRYQSGPQWLAEQILISKWVLAVAGTHGKTSTSAMLTWILECAGRRPGFLIGGIAPDLKMSARSSPSDCFVIEADEYDTAFFDKRSKFVHYRPRTAILNNLEFDHADIFADLAAIERQFHHLVRTIPATGRIVVNGRDTALKRVLAQGCWTPLELFGVPSGWEAGEPDGEGGFEVAWQGRAVGRLGWTLAGQYNRMNALAAIAAARHAGVAPDAATVALSGFQGVRRRLELKGAVRGVRVYDDFAHHPTAIRETIAGLRQRNRDGRILAVFEPRSNTLKRGVLKEALPGSFAGADRVYVYSAGLAWDAGSVFAPLGPRARCEADLDALVAAIAAEAHEADHVLVMSNGGFGGIHQKLLTALAKA